MPGAYAILGSNPSGLTNPNKKKYWIQKQYFFAFEPEETSGLTTINN
jgi:hypothetical protein